MSDPNSLENSPEDKELAELFRAMSKNPKTRRTLLATVKAHAPETPIPEIDMENRVLQMAKPLVDQVEKIQQDRLKEQVEARIEKARAKLSGQGYTETDIAAIEKLMTEKQIPSHDTAAEHYAMSKKLAAPAPSTLRSMTNTLPIDKKSVKEAGGIKAWARNEAVKAADEIKRGQVKLH